MSLVTAPLLTILLAAAAPAADRPFEIQVIDRETGRGVPLVELKTVNNIRLYTDSNGIVAFDEPGLMNRRVFFHVKSHGYEFPKDGFGYQGKTLEVTPAGSVRLEIERINIAERLYRITGGGIYRDSLLVNRAVPIKEPGLNGLVFGSDSVVNAVYREKIYWFWGDTNRPEYPLGNFKVPGATSELLDRGGLDPEVGINLEYFVDQTGFAKQTTPLEAEGPTWISGLAVFRDSLGRERMFAHYVNIRGGEKGFEVTDRGLVGFDDQAKEFKKIAIFPLDGPFPGGAHPFLHAVDDTVYVYYCDPYPMIRVEADPEKIKQLEAYEAFTCFEAGSRSDDQRWDRDDDGLLRWGWKADTDAVGPGDLAKLVQGGKIPPNDAIWMLRDADTGELVIAHRGSVYWNAYRGRWVMITCQAFGTSSLGEIWYAEADQLLGPWVYARKIVTHEDYSFYNPKQDPMFDKENGRVIFFEGTYTHTFSGNPDQTPRYDYNQIMYKLDLSDPRLNLPVAVYDLSETGTADRFGTRQQLDESSPDRPIAFWALERPGRETVPVYAAQTDDGIPCLEIGDPAATEVGSRPEPVFYVLPAETEVPPSTTVPLYEFRNEEGRRAYGTEGDIQVFSGYQRSPKPIGLVWQHPIRRTLALDD